MTCKALLVLAMGSALGVGCDKGPTRTEPTASASAPATTATPTAPSTAGATAATPAPAGALSGKVYGGGVKQTEAVAISAVLANPSSYNGKTVRVEGTITDICPKRGCWFEMAGEAPGEKLRFKVDDGVMTFPMEAKGQYAVAEGVVAVRELTLEETKQRAEYEAKEYGKPYDPASITKPRAIVRIDGTGAVLRDKK